MEVNVIWADSIHCTPSWSWNSDQNGWSGYNIWCVRSGEVTIQKEENKYVLHPGDCFFFDLSFNHICRHNPENPLFVDAIYLHSEQTVSVPAVQVVGNKALQQAVHTCVVHKKRRNLVQSQAWLSAAVAEFMVPSTEQLGTEAAMVRMWKDWIDDHVEDSCPIETLCKLTGYSQSQFNRIFKRKTGETPYQYFTISRVQKSVQLLAYTNYPLEQIASSLGFYDAAHFSRSFKQVMGSPPQKFRKNLEKSNKF